MSFRYPQLMPRLFEEFRTFWQAFPLETIIPLRPPPHPRQNRRMFALTQLGIVSARRRMMELATTYCGLII
jgi:hypothetical protein